MKKLLLVLLLLASCSRREPPPPEALRPVKTTEMQLNTSEPHYSLPGEVRAREEVPLAFQVGGRIVECRVDLGSSVHKGELLARLEPADYRLDLESRKAASAEAAASFSFAKNELARYRKLKSEGFVSEATLEQKESAFDAARARLEALQSNHEAASRRLDYTRLVAENDGVVTERKCNAGQVVNAAEPVLRLAESGQLEIAIQVPEGEIETVRHSENFVVELNALAAKRYQGKLRELAAAADPATRTYAARIRILNPDRELMLGMSARVGVESRQVPQMRLPMSAIVSRDGKPHVWRVDSNAVVHLVAITLRGIEGNTLVVDSGLAIGDKIVTAGANLLREGEKVRLQ